jgi:predicted metal-binding membrane protein
LQLVDQTVAPARSSERLIYVSALLSFGVAAAITIYFNRTMADTMRMPGGWNMSMMWMTMPGQSPFVAASLFAGMWLAMMIAMMLPSTLPMLLLYRRAIVFREEPRAGVQTFVLAAAYFLVWALFGFVVYAGGLAIAHAAMKSLAVSRVLPFGAAIALILAGSYQLTPWKSACLKHCRSPLEVVAHHLGGGPLGALRLGLHHGALCAACCWALMLIQIVLGIMNLAVMVAVALIIAFEKLLTRGEIIARVTGATAILAGLLQAVASAINLKGL